MQKKTTMGNIHSILFYVGQIPSQVLCLDLGITFKKDVEKLELIQRRAMSLIKELKIWCHGGEEREGTGKLLWKNSTAHQIHEKVSHPTRSRPVLSHSRMHDRE